MTAQCTEKTALLLDYTNSAKAYCEAVMELHEKIGSGDRVKYDGLYQIAEVARLSVETARVKMEIHVKQHGC